MAVGIVDDQTEELSWLPSADNLGGGIRYNVYASREWPVDVSRPENLVATALYDARFRYNRFAAMGYYFAITAMDRCGNESEPIQVTDKALMAAQQKLRLDDSGHVIGFIDHALYSKPNKQLRMPEPSKKKTSKKSSSKKNTKKLYLRYYDR